MMDKPIVIFLFLIFVGIQAQGQTQYSCGTGNMDSAAFVNKPWVGNNQFLLDLTDSIGYGKAIPKSGIQGGFDPQAIYWIPVKAWVYNDNNGDEGIDEVEVEESIRRLNQYFAGEVNLTGHASPHTLIQFYLRCNIAYINNSDYANNPSDNEIDDMWDDNHETAALNVHYAQSIQGLAGKARFPGSSKSFTIVINTGSNSHLGSTFPHEVGHAFDVAHTHQGRCWLHSDNGDCENCHQEAVSRAKIQPVGCGNFSGDLKCEVNGDGYCDTGADPNIEDLVQGNTQDGFTYNGSGKDNWDELWTPDIYNIMSYSQDEAKEYFSPMQVGTMYYWVLGMAPLLSAFDLHNENEYIDIYEPDNFQHPTNVIDFSETQHRGLHATRFGFESNPSFGYCDEDWVRFTIPENYSYKVNISTDPVSGAQQVDTQISLFDEMGTLLISNDNKGVGEIYSEISEFELPEGDYWIQVESVGNSAGEYFLTLEQCVEECCFQGLLGAATEINQSTGSFNLGLVSPGVDEFIGRSLNVVTSTLFFNNSDPLGFGGVGYPIPSSHLNAEICNNSEIVIDDLGQMIIGDINSNLTADVTFMDGTKLSLEEYGVIIVQPGSKLIIEDGAELRLRGGMLLVFDGAEVIVKEGGKLIYEAGTHIELNGNDAVLALGGLTRIGDDATFTFDYAGNESGYIRLLKEGGDLQRFSVGTNARAYLAGEGQNDLILYIEESAEFWEYGVDDNVPNDPNPSHFFANVGFANGKIVMEDHSRIVLLSKAVLKNMRVEPLNNQHVPRGITNFTFCNIENSSLYKIDVTGNLHYWQAGPLEFRNSQIKQSDIEVRGFAMHAILSEFDQCTIELDQSLYDNTINGCLVTNNSRILDLSTSELFIFDSEFYDNEKPVEKHMARLTAKCSRFERNTYALIGEMGSVVNLSTLYNGGYNYFDDNDYNIYLNHAGKLLLKEGYNQLYDANLYNVFGYLDVLGNTCPWIYASNNIWTPLSGGGPYTDPDHPDANEFLVFGSPSLCQANFVFGQVAEVSKCGAHDGSGGDDPHKSNSDSTLFPLVNSPVYFDSTAFDLAVREVANTTTVADSANGDDLLAADMYYELLGLASVDSVQNDSIARVVEEMKWGSLSNYKAIIERLFTDSVLTADENSSAFSPTVQNYVSVLMAFTDSIKTVANYNSQFQLEIMKASLFNMIGKKNQALQILTNINYCEHDSLQKLILEEQIQNLSFDLMAETNGPDMFLMDSITFELDSSIYQIPLESFIDSTGFGSYIQGPNSVLYSSCNTAFPQKSFSEPAGKTGKFQVYPNPTQTKLEIQILDNSLDLKAGFEFYLLDFTGKLLYTHEFNGVQSSLSLPRLPSALYFYQIKSGKKIVEQGKLSILN